MKLWAVKSRDCFRRYRHGSAGWARGFEEARTAKALACSRARLPYQLGVYSFASLFVRLVSSRLSRSMA